ncbi:biotin-dependent carboxyltransferase family protein [Hymenobacter sp. CRA2]|uniref:5-oxoprolinase subunit C family protein n=1 Tax=Hymenobacter sp. CRA2 TaxID=1955620 RepID=UPI00098FA617|nr:biotin-dependent carboxyltransferase family protein [Hymenobacter sp. CRA2]OON69458.1 hypothetical protein B0919_09285 [Hymenobacter sp. CRA2]
MSLNVRKPGLLTTVQDLGRPGYRRSGVVVGGAMDAVALRVANLLVGNEETAAGLEFTGPGPQLRFEADTLLALNGADFRPTLDGQPAPQGRVIAVAAGCELAFGTASGSGHWGYLAVAGGVAVPAVLGARATYLRAGLGGWQGRALRSNDTLPIGGLPAAIMRVHQQLMARCSLRRWAAATWWPAPELRYTGRAGAVTVRALPGPEFEQFDAASRAALWQQPFTMSPQADRMGARLLGPPLTRPEPRELLSSAVAFGTVQVPPGGQPVVLLADHQTTGGYPRIAQVISADVSQLVQAEPGQALRFAPVTLAEAQAAYRQQQTHLQQLRRGLALVYL